MDSIYIAYADQITNYYYGSSLYKIFSLELIITSFCYYFLKFLNFLSISSEKLLTMILLLVRPVRFPTASISLLEASLSRIWSALAGPSLV